MGSIPEGTRLAVPVSTGLVLLIVCVLMGGTSERAWAQDAPTKTVDQQFEVWFGYMTQTRISDRISLWADAHFVPGAFYVLRPGVTFHVNDAFNMTAGYGYLGLSAGSLTRELKRTEHRPWAQTVFSSPISEHWGFLQRIRYDGRFRRNVADNQLADGFSFVNRLRFLVNFRYSLHQLRFGDDFLPYVTFGNEILFNFGSSVVFNHFDQNRVTAGLGLSRKGVSVQLGYMNRYVQLASGNRFVMNHTLIFWVFHNIDLRRDHAPDPTDDEAASMP